MAGVHTSFLQLYDALPEELKLKILGYALRQDDPIDRQTASGFLDGRAQPLLSPKFKDAGEFSAYNLHNPADKDRL
jgi:hypothetical protein